MQLFCILKLVLVANKEENLQSLQGYVSALLVPNKHGEEIISALVDLVSIHDVTVALPCGSIQDLLNIPS